jgi:hypothetical protein
MLHRRLLPLFVSLAASLASLGCAETIDSTYATFAEAQRIGAVTAGWVPAWLPPSATSIREVHNIDTNAFMLTFAVAKGTQLSLPAGCGQVAPSSPARPPFKRDWWPSDVPANNLATHRHSFFACGGHFVAYSSAMGEGFVWSRGE